MGTFNHDGYLKDYKKRLLSRLTIDMKKTKRDEIQAHADQCDETLTGYIKKAVEMRMEREDKLAEKKRKEKEREEKEKQKFPNPFGEAMEMYARQDRNRKKHIRW